MKDLSLPELIGIIDTCFCCLVSFFLFVFFNMKNTFCMSATFGKLCFKHGTVSVNYTIECVK